MRRAREWRALTRRTSRASTQQRRRCTAPVRAATRHETQAAAEGRGSLHYSLVGPQQRDSSGLAMPSPASTRWRWRCSGPPPWPPWPRTQQTRAAEGTLAHGRKRCALNFPPSAPDAHTGQHASKPECTGSRPPPPRAPPRAPPSVWSLIGRLLYVRRHRSRKARRPGHGAMQASGQRRSTRRSGSALTLAWWPRRLREAARAAPHAPLPPIAASMQPRGEGHGAWQHARGRNEATEPERWSYPERDEPLVIGTLRFQVGLEARLASRRAWAGLVTLW